MQEIAQQFRRQIRSLNIILAISGLGALLLMEFFDLGVKGLVFMGFGVLAGTVIGVGHALFEALLAAIHTTRQDRR